MPSFIVILGLFYLVFHFQTTSKAFSFFKTFHTAAQLILAQCFISLLLENVRKPLVY